MKTDEIKAAEWLIAAFLKDWSWQMFEITVFQSTGKYPRDYSFCPQGEGRYRWGSRISVRAYVAQNWPKLYAALDGTSPIEAKIKLSAQIVKLKWNGERPKGSLTTKERRETTKSAKQYVNAIRGEEIRGSILAGQSVHNWNTCK